jgi:DNA-binding transcriptional ArsR family regulator
VPALPSSILEPLWVQVAALLPTRQVSHPLGCHRPRIRDRIVFDKLIQLLVFGCGYRRIADSSCSATTLRRCRDEWISAGVAEQLRLAVLAHGPRLGWLIGKSLLAYTWAMTDVYKALADPTRRAILDELTERDGQTLFELCARLATKHGLGSSRQAISQHLDVLESAGLVKTRREGRYKFHHLDTTPLKTILERWRPTHARRSR